MGDFILPDDSENVNSNDFSPENLNRLDPDIRLEHVIHKDGSPAIKFYKLRSEDEIDARNQRHFCYSPELFLILRLDNHIGVNGFNLESFTYNEQLINSWNSSSIMGSAENISLLIYRYLNSTIYFCTGVLEEKVLEKDVRQILIERYGDSIVYRSRKCSRVIQNSTDKGTPNLLCTDCNAITQIKQSSVEEDFMKKEVQDLQDSMEEDDHDSQEFIEFENYLAKDDQETKPLIKKERTRKKCKKLVDKRMKTGYWTNYRDRRKARVSCKYGCKRTFNGEDSASLEKHYEYDHSGPISCPVSESCILKYRLYLGKKMRSHLLEFHKEDKQTQIRCGVCNEVYTGVPFILEHYPECKKISKNRRKSINMIHTCELCGQVYKTMGGLRQHIRNFHEKRRFYCEEEGCKKEFNTKHSMLSHISCVHQNNRDFICSGCGKDYKHRHERRVCENKHAGKYLHHCQLCDKKFNIKKKYEQHIRVHTGEKPYSCPICAYRCARLDNLNTHTKKSHGMGYKEAESATGISASSTTKITIIPPSDITDENAEVTCSDPVFINQSITQVIKNKLPAATTLDATTIKLLNENL